MFMPIITISRGSYSRGKEVAESVAKRLGYDCISRDILLDTSELFNIPQLKLERAIHDAPSILDRFSGGKERYVALIRAALLNVLKEDNMVYHGLAGHFFLSGVSHVLKVRIISDITDRVKLEMQRKNISESEAYRTLVKDDEQRNKWSQFLYGINTTDSQLYDLVIHIRKISVENAVDIICNAAKLEQFQATPESRLAMENLALSAEVKAALIEINPTIEVSADNGKVYVKAKISESLQQDMEKTLKDHIWAVRGVKEVHINITPVAFYVD
jgi:cytidylate kinase